MIWVSEVNFFIKFRIKNNFLLCKILEKSGFVPERFYNAARPIFIFARIFGVMPVEGLLSSDPNKLKFNWISFRTIHTAIIIFGLSTLNVLSIYRTFTATNTNNTAKLTNIVFYSSNLYAMFCFLFIARKFPFVMKRWMTVEAGLPKVKRKEHQFIMTRKIRIVGLTFLITSIAEHLLSVIKSIYYTQNCKIFSGATEAYYRKAAPLVFSVFDFSVLRGIVATMFMITGTFMWNYMDVFIMVISFGLFNLFKQINRILNDVKRKVRKSCFVIN